MDINLENWNTQNLMHTSNDVQDAPGSGKTQCRSIRQNQNREVGRGGWRTGGGKGAYVTFGEWGTRKGKSFEM